jgi:hypothetical protein
LRFISPLAGEKFILQVCKIRQMWEKLLTSRLQGNVEKYTRTDIPSVTAACISERDIENFELFFLRARPQARVSVD